MTREEIIRRIVSRDMKQVGLTEEVVRQEAEDLYAAACDHFGTWKTALTYAGVTPNRTCRRQEYSRDDVLQKIRTLCMSGYDLSSAHNLKRDRRLYEAAHQHFGTWRKALIAAGINLKLAFLRSGPRKHNKKKLLEAIKQRHTAGQSLIWGEICMENRQFASAIKSAFGSWRKALIAAGIDPAPHRNHSNKQWDHARVIAAIRQRQQERKSLKHADVRREFGALANAGQRYFGSWCEAVRAAGLNEDP